MKTPRQLNRESLLDIVGRLHRHLFWDPEENRYDAGLEVNGGDLVEVVCELMERYDLVPAFDSTFADVAAGEGEDEDD